MPKPLPFVLKRPPFVLKSPPIHRQPGRADRSPAASNVTIIPLGVRAKDDSDPLSAFTSEKGKTGLTHAALCLIALLLAATVGGVVYFRPEAPPQPSAPMTMLGITSIQSRPLGAEVVIDGSRRGVAPIELSLPAGLHTLELRAGGVERVLPLTVRAGMRLSFDVDFQ